MRFVEAKYYKHPHQYDHLNETALKAPLVNQLVHSHYQTEPIVRTDESGFRKCILVDRKENKHSFQGVPRLEWLLFQV